MRSRVPLLSVLSGVVLVAATVCLGLARPSVARDLVPLAAAQPAPARDAVRRASPFRALCPDSFEPNEDFDQAWLLSPGSIQSYICCLEQGEDLDYFKFAAQVGDQLIMTLYELPANYDLCLYGPDRQLMACSTGEGTTKETIERAATQDGDHYLQIHGVAEACHSAQPYELDVQVKGPVVPLEIDSSPGTAMVDGSLGHFEWRTAERLEFEHGFLTVLNDEIRLYILVDVLGDDTADPPSPPGDWFWLTIDTDGDGEVTPGVDLNYALEPGTTNLRYQYYIAAGVLDPLDPGPIRSSVATGFDCFFADNTERHYIEPLGPVCNSHRVWELGIDLSEIDVVAEAGEIVRMGLRLASQTPAFEEDVPEGFTLDFGDLIEVRLAEPPNEIPGFIPGTDVGLEESPHAIEITQAIQDRANSLPLVQDKTTVARVYAYTIGFPGAQPGIIYLHGYRDGADLPGSPLSMLHTVPRFIDREELDDTANFLLPGEWTNGTVTFRARAVDLEGDSDWSALAPTVTFEAKDMPVYWILRVNMGTEALPVLVAPSRLSRPMTYLETVYPIPDMEWIMRDWWLIDALGRPGLTDCPDGPACPPDRGHIYHYDILIPLQDLWEVLSHAHDSSLPAADLWHPEGAHYYPFPDEIIGIVHYSGDSGGAGHATVIDTREQGMAHEVDHNLDRQAELERTWGKHVCNPEGGGDDDYWGCNAEGCDPDWQPSMCAGLDPCTDAIGEVGFDTRLPWWDGERHAYLDCRFTVLQGERRDELWTEGMLTLSHITGYPDLMSYCEAKVIIPGVRLCLDPRPPRWVSTYRWEALFEDAFPTISASSQPGQAAPEQPPWIAYVSGQVNDDGTGSLDPVFVQPGHVSTGISPGDYAIEVQDANGNPLYTHPFDISFLYEEVREEPPLQLDRVPFAFRLPAQQGVTRVLLKHGATILDSILVSAHAPVVTVQEPNGGENWTGTRTIRWQATDQDGGALSFIILYSPDDGEGWLPVAWGVGGDSYDVDTDTLPGSDEARVRVVVSDGYRTTSDDSNGPFWVGGKAPAATIVEPVQGAGFPPGGVVYLAGSGFDVDDGLLSGDSLVWSHESTIVGAGGELEAHLPVGIHRLTLTAVDSDGQTGSDWIMVYVGYHVYLPTVFRRN
jgi:hypothetical protein